MNDTASILVDISCCARCRGDHQQLKFVEFQSAPPGYSHWAMCPTNNEPILMIVEGGLELSVGWAK